MNSEAEELAAVWPVDLFWVLVRWPMNLRIMSAKNFLMKDYDSSWVWSVHG